MEHAILKRFCRFSSVPNILLLLLLELVLARLTDEPSPRDVPLNRRYKQYIKKNIDHIHGENSAKECHSHL